MRALSYLATRPVAARSMRSRQIAAELAIPAPFLAKILRQLAAADILASNRGRSGGFQLARDPHSISLESVVGVFQPLPDTLRCPLGYRDCAQRDGCPMHGDWSRIQGIARDLLRRTSLADIARRPLPEPQESPLSWRAGEPAPAQTTEA